MESKDKQETGYANKLLAKLLRSKHITIPIFVLSLLESTVLFFPLELILIPLMQINREKIWKITTAALSGCLCGAAIGYHIGSWLSAEKAQVAAYFGSEAELLVVQQNLLEQGFSYIFLAGVTPIPFQLAMLVAGSVQYSFGLFILATFLARSIRYFGLGALVYFVGNQAQNIIQKYKRPFIVLASSAAILVILINTNIV